MRENLDASWPYWQRAQDMIRNELQNVSFKTWIEPLTPLALEGQELYLLVPSAYIRNFIEPRYASLIESALSQASGKVFKTHFLLPEEVEHTPAERPAEEAMPSPNLMFNPKYSFDTFVIGNSNQFAHAAALAVAEAPAQAYNPLFIYGGVGLGKTHLLQAIGQFMRIQNPHVRLLYVSSEKFTYELINAIKTNTTQAFRNRYRNVDVLMIDDIQFIVGKDSSQEELFHTFNALHEMDRQIVLTSDKPPKELKGLEDRLRSRFEWGLIADIQPPDWETRMAILRKKAEVEGLADINEEVMEFIATHSENNIRELEGCLTRAIAFARMKQRPMDMETVQEALKDILNATAFRRATPETIMSLVCRRYNISEEDFISRKRNAEIAQPRKIAMFLARELTDLSLSEIGRIYGGRDHTTVMSACRSISSEYALNNELRGMVADMRRELSQ